mmetsp:Transcript_4032/g.6249  ORF Transcript_4032/g.6249 Transcript_4032/m.6249 type:complete len:121 (-) Transcript_4032:169-531(-)|eukprot:CAMPEP_0185025212 /NCGR_PEP_ID=MMETSP1103-20130426/8260_1 /TAXON_ID=36769 /ORGANISM="Paraphysomonas bandaiensis, Strain Caron Lab Isolate" /LENGTH=120 /DNA_ID=CAMNT_0027558363 /DNA_START=65 /DNA_END=427 /DNA_ORIENTATION=-
MSRQRKRAATANDVDLHAKARTTSVDYLNAYGGLEEEAEEQQETFRNRAVSVDYIREREAKGKKRSNSIDVVLDDLAKTFFTKRSTSRDGRTSVDKQRNSSVDILNAYGGIEEGDENVEE